MFFSVLCALLVFTGGFLLGFNYSDARAFFYDIVHPAAQYNSGSTTESALDSNRLSGNLGIKAIEETVDFILANSINKKTSQELVQAAIEGMISSLGDRYADYFPPSEYKKIMDSYSGTMSGIGIVVTLDDKNQVVVINVIEGTPASEKGILPGDIITAVNGTVISEMSLDQVVSMIKGREGTEVKITVLRTSENKSISFDIIRRRFYVPNFYVKVLEGNILYIQYIDFQEKGAEKLEEKLQELIDDSTGGIIIDLRNNLGGILDDAVNFCDLFLEDGVIVTVRGRSDNKDSFEEFRAKEGGYSAIPVVVLINGYSASAAELAAGALRDNERALLLGEKSFGKGTVQILNELPDGSGIKFTTAKYYLPSGTTIDGTGIMPDIAVTLTAEDTSDVQLDRAIEEIKKIKGN